MFWLTLPLAALAILAFLGLRRFLRVTAGSPGLRSRIERVFLLPVRQRPLPQDHYFKAYWTRR